MTTILTKKLTKLRKELQYHQSELEYIQEVLKEWHYKFEEFQLEYCTENNINIQKLNKENHEKVTEAMQTANKKKPKVDFKKHKNKDKIKKMYKQLAKKLHPDAGGDEKDFKKLTEAMSQNNVQKILDICEKHDILINVDNEIIQLVKDQIIEVKKKIEIQKSTYSWKLFSCEENVNCKNNLMKQFLKQLFNYGG